MGLIYTPFQPSLQSDTSCKSVAFGRIHSEPEQSWARGACQGRRRVLAGLSRTQRLRRRARAANRLRRAKPSRYFCGSRKASRVPCNRKSKKQELTAGPSKHQGCKARSAPAVAPASPHQLGAALPAGRTGMSEPCSVPGSSAGICLVLLHPSQEAPGRQTCRCSWTCYWRFLQRGQICP